MSNGDIKVITSTASKVKKLPLSLQRHIWGIKVKLHTIFSIPWILHP
jgi:hypothetical protein